MASSPASGSVDEWFAAFDLQGFVERTFLNLDEDTDLLNKAFIPDLSTFVVLDGDSPPAHPRAFIIGGPGTGKSTLRRYMACQCYPASRDAEPYPFLAVEYTDFDKLAQRVMERGGSGRIGLQDHMDAIMRGAVLGLAQTFEHHPDRQNIARDAAWWAALSTYVTHYFFEKGQASAGNETRSGTSGDFEWFLKKLKAGPRFRQVAAAQFAQVPPAAPPDDPTPGGWLKDFHKRLLLPMGLKGLHVLVDKLDSPSAFNGATDAASTSGESDPGPGLLRGIDRMIASLLTWQFDQDTDLRDIFALRVFMTGAFFDYVRDSHFRDPNSLPSLRHRLDWSPHHIEQMLDQRLSAYGRHCRLEELCAEDLHHCFRRELCACAGTPRMALAYLLDSVREHLLSDSPDRELRLTDWEKVKSAWGISYEASSQHPALPDLPQYPPYPVKDEAKDIYTLGGVTVDFTDSTKRLFDVLYAKNGGVVHISAYIKATGEDISETNYQQLVKRVRASLKEAAERAGVPVPRRAWVCNKQGHGYYFDRQGTC